LLPEANGTFGASTAGDDSTTFDRQNVYAIAPKAFHHTNFSWDGADSYRADSTLLEYNNCTAYADPLNPYKRNRNTGHTERVKRCNRDLVSGINKSASCIDNASIFTDTTCQDIFESGMIGVFTGATKLDYDSATGVINPLLVIGLTPLSSNLLLSSRCRC
jgi:hypothetical protein